MSVSRRVFLGAAGISALAAASRPALEALAGPMDGRAESAGATRHLAMVIDERKCLEAGECTRCIDACHRVHNVPAIADRAHEVKWVWKERFDRAFPSIDSGYLSGRLSGQPVVVLCNHCEHPPCVRVCPTRATWKRSDGIVMMDAHRCIGCRYCMAACPYGSRSFNWSDPRPSVAAANPDYPTRTKGVVEKCTFCEERLARGERPACVDACKARAIVFGDLNDPGSEVRSLLASRLSVRRRAELGTAPSVFYLV